MRYLYVFFIIFWLVSCKTKSDLTSTIATVVSKKTCPDNGTCKLDVFKNKTLQVKTDDFGETYLEIVNGNQLILKFEYKKQGNAKYQDSGYREEVFIELDIDNPEIETVNLKDKKLFFARWCYCKGQTGYYKINEGKLVVNHLDNNNFLLSLNFTINEVPQIIKEINQNFNLD